MKNSGNTNDKQQTNLRISFHKALKSFGASLPILMGVILLLGLFRMNVSSQMISSIFTGEWLKDTFIGSLKGMRTGLVAVFLYNRAIKIPLLPMVIIFPWAMPIPISFELDQR